MTEKPILFSGEMVRALLAGRKTQTRRIVKFDKLAPDMGEPFPDAAWVDGSYMREDRGGVPCLKVPYAYRTDNETWHRHFPRWEPKDRLWVKETFQTGDFAMNEPRGFVYRATDPDWESCDGWKWKPSIFMPRIASRITLEITGVRVERLQDISEEDAKAEGLVAAVHEHGTYYGIEFLDVWEKDPRKTYKRLWESINGKGSWEKNPLVWVVEFKRVTPCQTSPC